MIICAMVIFISHCTLFYYQVMGIEMANNLILSGICNFHIDWKLSDRPRPFDIILSYHWRPYLPPTPQFWLFKIVLLQSWYAFMVVESGHLWCNSFSWNPTSYLQYPFYLIMFRVIFFLASCDVSFQDTYINIYCLK